MGSSLCALKQVESHILSGTLVVAMTCERWYARFLCWLAVLAASFCSAQLNAVERNLTHNGLERWFLETRPSTFVPGNPVLMVLHGAFGSMYDTTAYPYSLQTSSEIHGYLLLAPNAVNPNNVNDTRSKSQLWNCLGQVEPPLPFSFTSSIDDVGYLAALADWAVAERGADPTRVYIMGVSNGGMMTYRALVETTPPRYAAAASLIALMPILTNNLSPAPYITTPLSILLGTKDKLAKWEGGLVTDDQNLLPGITSVRLLSALDTRNYWIKANQADSTKVQKRRFRNRNWLDGCRVTSEFYPPKASAASSSGAAAPVLFYKVHGGGHVVPSTLLQGRNPPLESKLGPICTEVDAVDLAWDFVFQYKLKR
jgi:polyhydroxybutyrate depolymerase